MSTTLTLSKAVHKDYGFVSGTLFDQFLHYIVELGPFLVNVVLSNQSKKNEQRPSDNKTPLNTNKSESGEPAIEQLTTEISECQLDVHTWEIEYDESVWIGKVKKGRRLGPAFSSVNVPYIRGIINDKSWPDIFTRVAITTQNASKQARTFIFWKEDKTIVESELNGVNMGEIPSEVVTTYEGKGEDAEVLSI